jgi:pyruvate/2-oxoglutarate dehydrogenase complex dihydrolipoamide acyltransferase (E2) component
MSPRRVDLLLPDLGLGDTPIIASVWLADIGARVYEGDRLLEVHAGEVTVDLPSPATGILSLQCVAEDEPIAIGQVLGVVEIEAE